MNDAAPLAQTRGHLRERYGSAFREVPTNATIEVILGHRSCRAFRPDPLPEGTLEMLVAAAQSAATSSNLQSWSVVAVENRETLKKLSDLSGAQKQVIEAPLTLCFLADLARLAAVADSIGHRREGLDYLESFIIGAIDAGLAAQNACVAAESMGLGTCYLGSLRNHPDEVAKILKLPDMAMAVFGVTIGWPDEARPAFIKPRLPQSSVLHREAYDAAEAIAPVKEYEGILDIFNKKVRNGQPLWGLRSSGRVADGAALSGRDRMKDMLRGLGFKLR